VIDFDIDDYDDGDGGDVMVVVVMMMMMMLGPCSIINGCYRVCCSVNE